MKKTKILVILGSTRNGRFGEKVAKWAMEVLGKRKDANFELVDLLTWNLPFFNFAISPSREKDQYQSELQKKWAEKIASADGYLMITPEYNHGYSAVLKNAIDYLWYEWNHKPVTFISYGGPSGGLRAVEQLRQVVIELEMIPIRQAVLMSSVWSLFTEDGKLQDESFDKRLNMTTDKLVSWANSLQKIRGELT